MGIKTCKGLVIIYGRGWHQREIIFLRTFCLTQLNFVSKLFLPMQLKPIIFLYPTNYTFLSNLCTRRWLKGSIQLRYQVVKGGETRRQKAPCTNYVQCGQGCTINQAHLQYKQGKSSRFGYREALLKNTLQ